MRKMLIAATVLMSATAHAATDPVKGQMLYQDLYAGETWDEIKATHATDTFLRIRSLKDQVKITDTCYGIVELDFSPSFKPSHRTLDAVTVSGACPDEVLTIMTAKYGEPLSRPSYIQPASGLLAPNRQPNTTYTWMTNGLRITLEVEVGMGGSRHFKVTYEAIGTVNSNAL